MRKALHFIASMLLVCTAGCRSPYIHITVLDKAQQPMYLIEVDYPSASFGTQHLAPGQTFQYPIKVLGSGKITIQWSDANGKPHQSTGPTLNAGDAGTLLIQFFSDSALPSWNLNLTSR